MIRILLVGPLPPPMGGNTRHFTTLIDDLKAHDEFDVEVFNTSREQAFRSRWSNLRTALRTLWIVARRARRVDIISFHASDRGMLAFGPFVVLVGWLTGTPTLLRMFGGSFGDYYRQQGALRRWLARRFVLSADVILMQTRRMMGLLQGLGRGRIEWFSTYIHQPEGAGDAMRSRDAGSVCQRFIFLGHLTRVKGIETMLDVAGRLPAGVTIDLYGPLDDFTEQEILDRGGERVRYCGFLEFGEVHRVLPRYDALVLPTYHRGEGYPGVIAEAYTHALPVISTTWLAIPEIVGEDSGLLFEPKDALGLLEAIYILHSDPARWRRLSEGAHARAEQFDHGRWARRFVELCRELSSR